MRRMKMEKKKKNKNERFVAQKHRQKSYQNHSQISSFEKYLAVPRFLRPMSHAIPTTTTKKSSECEVRDQSSRPALLGVQIGSGGRREKKRILARVS